MKNSKYLLEITVFLSGAVVMIFELAGSRVLGPFFGTSIFIWTSLIGVILGSLSIGYYWGGKLADKKPSLETLSIIIFLSASFMSGSILIKDATLFLLSQNLLELRLASVVAALILFMPASVLLGMISPYVVKLRVKSMQNFGSTVGNLSALSTAGSIVGTFLSGFYLIPQFGTTHILILLSIILLLLSIVLSIKSWLILKLGLFLAIIFYIVVKIGVTPAFGKENLKDIDTAYNRVWIYDFDSPDDRGKMRRMRINNENSSQMYLDSPELVSEYTKYYHLVRHFVPQFQTTLMLGGAGYSYPKDYLLKYQTATIDVVEIDPKLTELAKRFFNLHLDPRLSIYHEDGRVYLNRLEKKYDAVLGDAFSSHYSLPYQLTTKETVAKKYDALNDDGAVILNIISSIEGDSGQFLRAEYWTYKFQFPQVYLFPVKYKDDGNKVQNVILVALKSPVTPTFASDDPEIDFMLQHLWSKEIARDVPILTDDFAPVDYYINKTI